MSIHIKYQVYQWNDTFCITKIDHTEFFSPVHVFTFFVSFVCWAVYVSKSEKLGFPASHN